MGKRVADALTKTIQAPGIKRGYEIMGDTFSRVAHAVDRSASKPVPVQYDEAGAVAACTNALATGSLRSFFNVRVGAILASCVAGLLTQCAMVDTIHGRFDNINRSSAQARNQAILLNLVRSSRNIPLNFVAVSRISGSTQTQLGGGLPSMLVGPYPIATGAPFATNAAGTLLNVVEPALTRDVGLNSTTLNASTNAANSFDLTVLDSKQFYQALLSPIDLVTLDGFIRQGFSHELLYRLFIDSIRRTASGRTVEYRNDPKAPCETDGGQRQCFKDVIDGAVASGLTVETLTVSDTGAATAKSTRGSDARGGTRESGDFSTIVYARMCFDPVLARGLRSENTDLRSPFLHEAGQPRCGTWSADVKAGKRRSAQTETLNFDIKDSPPIHVQVFLRSTFGVYRFLGRILAAEATEDARLREDTNLGEDTRLFAITDGSDGPCFVSISLEGKFYCVPQNGAESTKRIFSLLTQLLALKTQAGDLNATPVVRVTP
jgi:hypothetical protein